MTINISSLVLFDFKNSQEFNNSQVFFFDFFLTLSYLIKIVHLSVIKKK